MDLISEGSFCVKCKPAGHAAWHRKEGFIEGCTGKGVGETDLRQAVVWG